MTDIGRIRGELSLDDRFTPAISKALNGLGAFGVAAGAAVAVTAAVGVAFAKAASDAMKMADALDNQAKATQVGVEKLQLYNAAAQRAGQGPEAVTTAIQRMQRAIGDGTKETDDALKRLGTTANELKRIAPEKQFELIQQRLGGISDPATKAATAMAIFGKSGANLLALSGDALPKLSAEMERLGLIIDEKTIASVDKLEEDMDLLSRTGSALWQQLGAGVASSGALSAATNQLTEWMGQLNRWVIDNREQITAFVDKGVLFAARAIQVTITVVAAFVKGLGMLGQVTSHVHVTMASWFKTLAESPLTRILPGISAYREQIIGIADKVLGAAKAEHEFFQSMERGAEKLDRAGVAVGDFAENLKRQQGESVEAARVNTAVASTFENVGTSAAKAGKGIDIFAERAAQAKVAAREYKIALEAFEADLRMAIPMATAGVGDEGLGFSLIPEGALDITVGGIEDAERAQQRFNEALQRAADMATALPGAFGKVAGSIMTATASLAKMQSDGGFFKSLKSAFANGSSDAGGGLLGILGGIGSAASMAMPFVNLGITAGTFIIKGLKSLFGRNGGDAMSEISRDMGVSISKGLADQIAKSGKPVALALADIFKEGKMSVDRLAEEMGDIISGIGRGDFSKEEGIGALNAAASELSENFERMGSAGVEQMERLFAAAAESNIGFEGMNELAAQYVQKANELGIAVNNVALEALGLQDAMAGAFAPATMEEMAEKFGKTNDEIRAMGEALGINVQTNLDRVAASVGLTADEFNALGTAMSEQLGIPAEQLKEFLEATGLSAEALAKQLGVEVGAGAQAAADAQDVANERLKEGAGWAEQIKQNLTDAALASKQIQIPAPSGGNVPHSAAGNVFTRPGITHIAENEPELVAPVRAILDNAVRIGAAAGGGGGGDPELRQAVKDLPRMVAKTVREELARVG